MKKISLLLAALVMTAAAGLNTISAQRVWAYELSLSQENASYTFTFKAVADATEANLVFTAADGTEVGKVAVKDVKQGANTVTLTEDQIPGKDVTLNWAVELKGAAIEALTEVTNAETDVYKFYLPQDVVAINNPESKDFGVFFVLQATNGASDGGSQWTKSQKAGVFVFDALLGCFNMDTAGILPANVTIGKRMEMHRMAVDSKDNVYIARNLAPTAVWKFGPADEEAVNVVAGIEEITLANSICIDENDVLYVMEKTNAETGGTIYKIENGKATKIIQSTVWANADNSMAADGRGGLWVAQHRWGIDAFNILTHVNAKGEIDYAVNSSADDAVKAMFDKANNASYRGQMAYDTRHDVLGFGGNKVVTTFNVTYDATTGVPTLTKGVQTPAMGTNIDGVAFDYAGDLLVVSASAERLYKYAMPTTENSIVVPAQKSQTIVKSTGTFVDNTEVAMPQVQKVVRDGQVYVVRDGVMYDMMGKVVE